MVEGNLLLVMWENHADPIITGREQLGYSKIFASIDDIHTYGGVSKTALTSWGFRFLELEFDANRQPENLEELKRVLNNPDSQGIMHYKYIPRTGGGFTQADAEYVCLNPKAAKLPDDLGGYAHPVPCGTGSGQSAGQADRRRGTFGGLYPGRSLWADHRHVRPAEKQKQRE